MLQDKNKAIELLQLIVRHQKGQTSAVEKLIEELKRENEDAKAG